ncbi:MAG: S8 family serine peptidase, partial [Bacteroidota bacterium]
MFRIFLLTSLFFLQVISPIRSNDHFYYSPKGKESLELSHTKILIQFASGLSIERQQEILVAHKLVAPIQNEYLLPAPRVTLAPLVDVHSDEEVWRLLSELRAYPYIEYAYPVFNHSDGTAMGLQSKLLVRLKTDNQYPVLENMALRYGLQIAAQNEFDDLLFHLSIQDATADPLSIAQFLFETKLFEYVEPDFLRFMHRMSTNDPALSRQWSVRNTGQNSGTPGTVGADMQVMDAWRTTTGSASVRIAVLDEGVDLNHPDLVGNLLRGYDATEQNSGGAPSGDDAHGTACAGIVAAVGNNGIGMAGVAYGSKIVPIRIAYSNGESWVTSSAWISNAINWAWREGQADVMSNSWGGGGSSFSINSAINNAIEQGRNGLGTPVVFAAGNENTNVSYPADYSPTIAVGAMSMCYERKSPNSCDNETWWGSNYGTHLDVVAPGTRIYAADISGAAGYSDADYAAYFNGTSSATPNVAGVAALILSANGNLTEQQVRFALESTCRKVGNYTYNQGVTGQPTGSWHPEMGYGLVNAAAAIQAVAPSQADDAGIMEIINPTNAICGTRVQPTVRLRNNGSNTLRRVNIHTRISSEEVQVYEWTGNLASTTTTEVTLPEITAAASTHTLEIYTSLPNAKSDSNPSNDRAFAAFSIGSERFSLNIMLDNYGSETSWEVVDVSENVILQGGPYQDNTMGQEINELFCLPNGCYELVFYDAYDDGMCCGYGEGSYQLVQLSDNQTLATGGQYTDRIAHDFCIDSPIEEEEPSPDPLIVEITSVTNVRCHGDRSGAAAISARGGISPYTYEWSSGHTQASANNLGADTYTITVEDAAGQSSVQTIVISQPSRLQTTATAQTATDNQGGSASVDVTGGTTPYRYRWSNGENTATISNLSSGIYVVTVTDQNNCSQTESVMVNNESTPELSANITIINSLRCNGDSDGTARVQISGGIAPYSFRWSNGGTAVQTNNLSEGAFAVTVSDSRGHSLRTESYMTAPSALSLQMSSQTATDNEGGSANVGVTGGTAPYRYRWSTGGNTAAITNLSSATYTVTVTDQNNCSKVASVVVANEITPDPIDDSGVRFEKGQLLAVDDNWQTVELIHNYQSMIVIATVRLPNTDTNPVVTRIKNATGNRFDIKLQNPSGASVGSLVVDYFVVEEGIYTETEHGIKMEAVKAWSTKTASRNDWILERRTYQNNYQSPVVLGQVMTNNDARWSVFWASSSSRRNAAPEQNKLAIGKHVGEDLNSDRADEQIGYVVFESGIQEINNTKFYTALGADKIRGVSNSTNGYAYNINGLSAA